MTEIPLRQPDDDLIPLLRKATDKELSTLVDYITQKGSISAQLPSTSAYKSNYPKHSQYDDEIAAEIQKFGGNTIVNIMRWGEGVKYKEIVCDVAKKLKVNFNSKQDVDFIEQQILLKIIEKSWEKMSDDEKRMLVNNVTNANTKTIPQAFPLAAFQAAIKLGGFASYQIALIVSNAVARIILGRGLALAVNAGLTRYMAVFAGPIGWAVTALWTIFDAAGPAYRVTIPCVIHIACIRQRYILKENGLDPDNLK